MALLLEYSTDYGVTVKGDNLFIEGVFAKAMVKNENSRVYPIALLEREVSKLLPKIENKQLFGQLNHPEEPQIDLSRVAIRIDELFWVKNELFGKAKVLDTPMGEIAKTLVREGQIGISSRGIGTVGADGIVRDNYQLITFDLVADPSTTEMVSCVHESIRRDDSFEKMMKIWIQKTRELNNK
ncbi:hypothetical protein [Desulfocurvibacter africanus]|uniref:hypothetical protein n=1 Tax=Desulfocurvibacter africanus TaxID=873 RepID=UPI0006859DE7|nr:hypothetical protein [Desulfocurvibacter africanus]